MKKNAIIYAVLAAAFYGVSAPFSKLLMTKLPPMFTAALLYLGAGLGMAVLRVFKRSDAREARVTRRELPFVTAMIILDIAAPILLMLGLSQTSPGTVSLLNNFEIVVTAVVALAVFREAVGRRMWFSIALITLASALLSIEDLGTFMFSPGALLALLACVCWGFENNCTRMLSLKDPLQIVLIKGIGSGLGALIVAALTNSLAFDAAYIFLALLLGFIAYGMSIAFYIRAQRELGAARTSAYYALAPFIGVGLSFVLGEQGMSMMFFAALALMLAGAYLAAFEKHSHAHLHSRIEHEHRHSHGDGHHLHEHNDSASCEHSHAHVHEELSHRHPHTPDPHHGHAH